MNKLIVIFCVFSSLALTPTEKRHIKDALTEIGKARTHYANADFRIAEADTRAEMAEAHAKTTEERIAPLERDIGVAHKNEEALANKVQKYEPFWVAGHKFWGIGSIIAGFGILAKHLLILAGFLILLGLLLWALSMFFPVLRPVLAFFVGLWGKITHRKP